MLRKRGQEAKVWGRDEAMRYAVRGDGGRERARRVGVRGSRVVHGLVMLMLLLLEEEGVLNTPTCAGKRQWKLPPVALLWPGSLPFHPPRIQGQGNSFGTSAFGCTPPAPPTRPLTLSLFLQYAVGTLRWASYCFD
eukprot:2291837-Rhodomonas_salina.1